MTNLHKNLRTLFLVTMANSLSSSIMFGSLALFLSSSFGYNEAHATDLVASYLALNFTLPLLGGFIGNRYVNFKKLFCCGMGAQFIAYLILAWHTHATLTIGLSAFLMGSMVATVSTVFFVNECTGADSQFQRRAMLWNYTAMNAGFLCGFIVSGLFGIYNAYWQLFLILSLLPLFSIFMFIYKLDFEHTPTQPIRFPISFMLVLILILILIIHIVLQYVAFDRKYLLIFSLIGVVALFFLAIKHRQLKLIGTLLFYMSVSICFWSIYLLSPEAVLDIMEHHADLSIGHFHLAPQWAEIIDSVVLVVCGPTLALIIEKCNERRIKVQTFVLFAIGLLIIAAGTAFLSHSSLKLLDYKIPFYIFVIYFGLLALAETFVGPEGYNLPRAFSPPNLRGLATGTWVASVGIASLIASKIGDAAVTPHLPWNLALHNVMHVTWQVLIGVALITLIGGFIIDRRRA